MIPGTTRVRQVEAAMRVPLGEVAVVRERFDGAIETYGARARHHLQLSLLPFAADARACFPERWGTRRFEAVGALFLLPADVDAHVLSACSVQQSVTCAFDPHALAAHLGIVLDWNDQRLRAALDIANTRLRHLLFRMGEELRNAGLAGTYMVELLAMQAAIELARHMAGVEERAPAGGLAPWRLRLIDDYLERDCAAASLAEMARLCRLSVRHLTRAFRASRGRSIGSHVTEHRIDRARTLLAAGLSVKVVAAAVGFTAPTNFAAAFRRVTGETPRAYRQRVVDG